MSQDPAPPWLYEQNGFPTLLDMQRAHARLARAARPLLHGKKARVIDLGCGNGALLRLLCEDDPGTVPYGVDREPARIARARELFPEHAPHFVTGCAFDFESWWQDDWTFDLMILTPGRFLEVSAAEGEALRTRIAGRVSQVLLYAYSDWLERYGDVETMARLTGFSVTDLSADPMVRGARVAEGQRAVETR